MSLFMGPEEHAANPPSSWNVVKVGSRWALRTTPDQTFETYRSRKAAEADKVEGHWVAAYAEEGRWYAGGTPAGWKSWEEAKAERDHNAARWAANQTATVTVHPAYADGTYDGPVGPVPYTAPCGAGFYTADDASAHQGHCDQCAGVLEPIMRHRAHALEACMRRHPAGKR